MRQVAVDRQGSIAQKITRPSQCRITFTEFDNLCVRAAEMAVSGPTQAPNRPVRAGPQHGSEAQQASRVPLELFPGKRTFQAFITLCDVF